MLQLALLDVARSPSSAPAAMADPVHTVKRYRRDGNVSFKKAISAATRSVGRLPEPPSTIGTSSGGAVANVCVGW